MTSKFNKKIYFFYVIDIYKKYAWVITLKDEKGITVTDAFEKVLCESSRKPSKIWVNRSSEFCKR